MCLTQGPQCSDAGEARTRGLSDSEFKIIFDLKSDIFLVRLYCVLSYGDFMGCACVLEANSRA